MTLSNFALDYKGIRVFVLPSDLTIETVGPDLILYHEDDEKNHAFLRTIPQDDEMYHFFVKNDDNYIYLGGRFFNNRDIAHRCIIEGHGWQPTLKACEHAE